MLDACPPENELVRFARGLLSETLVTSVSSHLDSCESCRIAVAFAASEQGTPRPATPGTRVGRYVIEGLLGAGAMGSVFSAVDEVLHRKVALKLLHEGRDVARLEREAQSMARLNHSHVVTVFEFGEWEGGRFIAMELVDGVTLDAWLPGHSPAQKREALLDGGRGLHAAHLGGVVHRDFKPANLLVARDGRVKVTDFGLSRPSPGAVIASGSLLATQAGSIIGTPAYMSPEQLDGRAADERSDQFAFATVFVEALTGARPFNGTNREALRAAMEREPTFPPGLRREERKALKRALQIDASLRFPSMEALLEALQPTSSRRWPVAVIAVSLLAALSFGVWQRAKPTTRDEGPGQAARLLTLEVDAREAFEVPNITRVAIGDPTVADVMTLGQGMVEVIAKHPGRTTMLAWTDDGEPRKTYLIVVNEPEQAEVAARTLEAHTELAVGETVTRDGADLERVAIGDPAIADVHIDDAGIRVTASAPGATSLILWTKSGEQLVYLLTVR